MILKDYDNKSINFNRIACDLENPELKDVSCITFLQDDNYVNSISIHNPDVIGSDVFFEKDYLVKKELLNHLIKDYIIYKDQTKFIVGFNEIFKNRFEIEL